MSGHAKNRLKQAINAYEASKPAAPEPKFKDEEHDGDNLELSVKEVA